MSNSLILTNPTDTADQITHWIKELFIAQHLSKAVIAVSGGIDSALSLTLLTRALGPEAVYPILLPFADQSTTDSLAIIDFNHIPRNQVAIHNIKEHVLGFQHHLDIVPTDHLRLGNIMARVRMIMVYDRAKQLNALVCGTENKSEHYLGYFTRFGDAAADFEPLIGLYKTQVRQLAEALNLPAQFLTKAPTAGLWDNQTDETELGFSYQAADQVLWQLIEEGRESSQISLPGVDAQTIAKIINQVRKMAFKLQVPYQYNE